MARPETYLLWYRPAVTTAVLRVAGLSAAVMSVGMTVLGVALYSERVPTGVKPWAVVVGALGTLFGPISAAWRLSRLWQRDEYLAARREGVELALAQTQAFVSWDELASASAGAGRLRLALRDGRVLEISDEFLGESHGGIARELEMLRRRAGMGLAMGRIP